MTVPIPCPKRINPFLKIIKMVLVLISLVLLSSVVLPDGMVKASGQPGMCVGQKQVTEAQMGGALAIMEEIISLGKNLTPEDEETIIRSQGLTSERMNCILGKLMAGNDIFGWGPPGAYGVELSPEELESSRKFNEETTPLRKYLEETLNIELENH